METKITKKVSIVLRPDFINMEVKERILLKAADLFLRYGVRSVTMDEIAGQLGISKKTIYQFFTDKDEIVEGVIEAKIQDNECKCDTYLENSENAVHQVFLSFGGMEEIGKTMNPLIMYDLEKHHPKTHKKIRGHINGFLYQVVLDNLHRGINEKLYRPEINVDITARHRIESVFMMFNQDAFPHGRYLFTDVARELGLLYIYSVATPKGVKLIEKYLQQQTATKK
ncbi:MAG TPA: TetR/AcrR family transcriptional regulator [Chitinophagaceae bacterium]|jgi:AcrR family transcriptional regulator|nr:TetR/AcrR family transcriptional regulator [Chitinophagaceae bacterium]